MPELPEVETVVRGLRPHIVGNIISVTVTHRKTLRYPIPRGFINSLNGQTIIGIERRAKYILIELSSGKMWLTHLGMTGSFRLQPQSATLEKHDHISMIINDDLCLVYNDPRRFGFVDIIPNQNLLSHKFLNNLGYEPFDPSLTPARFFEIIQARSSAIKIAIMDQALIVGVGNIYASESLYDAKINPTRSANTLNTIEAKRLLISIRKILNKAITAGGSTIQNFIHADGTGGYFQHEFKVYGKAGARCACSKQHGVIEKIMQQGRATFFCNACQT
jgi:formamidopyrimidine-DNA glycosylase